MVHVVFFQGIVWFYIFLTFFHLLTVWFSAVHLQICLNSEHNSSNLSVRSTGLSHPPKYQVLRLQACHHAWLRCMSSGNQPLVLMHSQQFAPWAISLALYWNTMGLHQSVQLDQQMGVYVGLDPECAEERIEFERYCQEQREESWTNLYNVGVPSTLGVELGLNQQGKLPPAAPLSIWLLSVCMSVWHTC